jgi:signal transduction histidine kinase
MSSGDLAQIFQNLIENAIRYLQEVPDPQIVITAKTQQDQLAIGVIDNGRGVDEELLETIFTPTSTYSDQGELHGKGLALVQTIVAENGGKVWAENNEWGGLSVWFTLAGL